MPVHLPSLYGHSSSLLSKERICRWDLQTVSVERAEGFGDDCFPTTPNPTGKLPVRDEETSLTFLCSVLLSILFASSSSADVDGDGCVEGSNTAEACHDFRYFSLLYFITPLAFLPSTGLFPFALCSFVVVFKTTGVDANQENDWPTFGAACCSWLVLAPAFVPSALLAPGCPRGVELSAISLILALECLSRSVPSLLPSSDASWRFTPLRIERTLELNDPISRTTTLL